MPKLIAQLGLDGSAFDRGLALAEAKASMWGGTLSSKMKGMLAGAFGGAALVATAKKAMDLADELGDLSAKTGLSTNFLQEMRHAASVSGAELGNVTGSVQKMQLAMMKAMKGDEATIDRFKRLGVTIDDIKSKRPEEVFMQLSDTVKDLPYSAQLTEDMMKTLGKSSMSLLPMMKDGMSELAEEAHNLNKVMGEDTVASLKDAHESIEKLGGSLLGTLAPAFAKIIDWATTFLNAIKHAVGGAATYFGALSGGASHKEAVNQMAQYQDSIVNSVVEGDISRAAKAAQYRKPDRKTLGELGIEPKVKDSHPILLNADSLSKIGGFGSGADRMASLQRVSERIADATEEIKDRLETLEMGV